MKQSAIKKIVLAGAFVVPQIAVNAAPAFAGTLQKQNSNSGYTYLIHNRNGVNYHSVEQFAIWTIDGKWVWCIEPLIYTDVGVTYNGSSDIVTGGNVTIRLDKNTTTTLSYANRQNAVLLPWILLEASIGSWSNPGDVENILNTDIISANEKDAYRNFIIKFRQLDRPRQWAYIQVLYWNLVSGYVTSLDGSHTSDPTGASYINGVWAANPNGEPLTGSTQIGNFDAGGGSIMYRTITAMHQWTNAIRTLMDDGILKYQGGGTIYHGSGGEQTLVAGSSGRFEVDVNAYIKVTKDVIGLNPDNQTTNTPKWNFEGVKVGVYSNQEATNKVADITLKSDGSSDPVKVKSNTDYYLYELDTNGNPIKTQGGEVTSKTGVEYSYASGLFDTENQLRVYGKVHTSSANSTAATAINVSLHNVPKLVNFTFSKGSSVSHLQQLNPQYSVKGAVYGLYYDKECKNAVYKNGSKVTATIGDDGTGSFNNLYEGTYYLKEISVPTTTLNGITGSLYTLDPTVYTIDMTNPSSSNKKPNTENDATSNSAYQAVEYDFKLPVANSIEKPLVQKDSGLTIQKSDAQTETTTPQGQATFKGAEFEVEIYKVGTDDIIAKGTFVTDEKGYIDITDSQYYKTGSGTPDKMADLYADYDETGYWGVYDYKVTETKAPDGYHLNNADGQTISKTFKSNVSTNNDNQFTWNVINGDIADYDTEIEIFKRQKVEDTFQTSTTLGIPDTEYTLTYPNGHKEVKKTDSNGKVKFDGLIKGNYTLEETKAAAGYIRNPNKVTFTVDENQNITSKNEGVETDDNGKVTITQSATAKGSSNVMGNGTITADNIPTRVPIKIVKTNEKGTKLSGAEFKLTHVQDGKTQTLTTNANGEITFENLIVGDQYTIEETKAPKGYKLPSKRQKIEFRAESTPVKNSYAVDYIFHTTDVYNAGDIKSSDSSAKKVSKPGSTQDGISFTVDANKNMSIQLSMVNNTWKKLPATGSKTGAIVGGVSMTLILVGAGYWVYDKHKKVQ